MKLNKDFVKRNLEKAKEVRIFGILVEELSKEELLAVVGWAATLKKTRPWSNYSAGA